MRPDTRRTALPSVWIRRVINAQIVPQLLEVVGHQAACLRAASSTRLVDDYAAGYLHGAVGQALGETLLALDGTYAATFERVVARILTPVEARVLAGISGQALSGSCEGFDAGVDAGIDDAVESVLHGQLAQGWIRPWRGRA